MMWNSWNPVVLVIWWDFVIFVNFVKFSDLGDFSDFLTSGTSRGGPGGPRNGSRNDPEMVPEMDPKPWPEFIHFLKVCKSKPLNQGPGLGSISG